MELKQLALEFVDLVKIDRTGQEYRESKPRWLAEMAIGRMLDEEPEVAYAWIEPIQAYRWASYPIRPATPRHIWLIATALAHYLPSRLVD
ncbi:hypothetical protein TFLX_05792 [Thermoflexales bacterium]|nr:hypothetical protein TFLX_05792 [Thermoflexales bacterium]